MQLQYLNQNKSKAVVGCSYISFLDSKKTMMHHIKAPCDIREAWSQIYLSPTSLYSSLVIDRNRFPKPKLDEDLECAMDYEFNLKCLMAGKISNIPGYYCGYRVRNQSITRSNKRISQLINHSCILSKAIFTENLIQENEKATIAKLYALGLSRIANDNEEICRKLKTSIETEEQEIINVLNKISSLYFSEKNTILIKRVLEVLKIGVQAKKHIRSL